MQRYCFNCMNQVDSAPFCPRCGKKTSDTAAEAPYHLTPGTILAERYLVGKFIGEGGFGITYIGLDTVLSKRVAIKEFYPSGAANRTNSVSDKILVTKGKEEFFGRGVERFMLEAKSVAAFSDEDGIVDVLDYFPANNTAYIVMEYLEGENLKDYTSRYGLFSSNDIIELMLPVMKSLKSIHSKGVIHRDISPDNIMFTRSGKLKLMDFGSARYYTNEDRELSVVLKQGFAPEEQYRKNGKQGPYTDVYALCATIYCCITGKVPEDSLDRQVHDALLPPSKLGFSISPEHEAALMHGLAIYAEDRTQNMDVLMNEFKGSRVIRPTIDANQVDINRVKQYNEHQNRQNPQRPVNQYHPQQRPPQQRPPQSPQWQPPQNMPPYNRGGYRQQQKSNAPIIVAIIIAAAAILILGGIMAYMLFNNDSDSSDTDTTAATTPSANASGTSQATVPTFATAAPDTTKEVTRPTEAKGIPEPPTHTYPETSPLSTEDIDDIHSNYIYPRFGADIAYMNEYKDGGSYDYVVAENGRVWIGTKGSFHDDENDKVWYFFDENQELYFVYRHANNEEYRYYIHDNQVIRYYVGVDQGQQHYDMGDSAITSSVKSIVKDANDAYDSVYYYTSSN